MANVNLDQVALEALRTRITKTLPDQIRACLDQLTEEQLWWRPNEKSNSVGNLVLHVCGSMRHYLCKGIGGIDYRRDRPAEFAERGPLPKTEVEAVLDQTIDEAIATFKSFDTSRFLASTDEPDYYKTTFELILGVAIHLATHTGQIVWATKMLKEGGLDELWINVERRRARGIVDQTHKNS